MTQFDPDLISVITPTFNSEDTLADTVEAVIGQTYERWELIIVDDGSADNSPNIAKRYAADDERITFIPTEENRGVSHARNIGLEHAKGQYVTFLDSDDLILSEKFAMQIAFMKKNDLTLSYTQYRRFKVGEIEEVGVLRTPPKQVTYKKMLSGNKVPFLTALYDRTKAPEVQFDETLVARNDYAFWLDLLRPGRTGELMLGDYARYRVHGSSLSSNKIRSAKLFWHVLYNREKLSFVVALYYFVIYAVTTIAKRARL